ncbi:MAG: hypothetical protein ABI292_10770 [Rhodoferax sp.]
MRTVEFDPRGVSADESAVGHRDLKTRDRVQPLTPPRGKEIHVIADNLSAHKTRQVGAFLAEYPQVHMHFTPTYLARR